MNPIDEELAQEELGTEEMRLLLDRISHEELGGSGISTLADVA